MRLRPARRPAGSRRPADLDQYLAQLRAAGIGYASPDTAIILGNTICDSFRKQIPYQRMTDILMTKTNLSVGQAQTVIANATTYLCPEAVIT